MKLPWEDDEYGFKQNNSTLPWEKDEYSLKQTSNKLPWEEEILYTPAKKEPKLNLLQRAGDAISNIIPSKETRDSISQRLFPAALSGKEGGLIENAIKNEQALRSRENLGKGEAFLSGVRSGAMFGAGADEIRANNPQASGWVTGGEVLGSLIPSVGLYGGTLKAGQAATKLPGIGQALSKASPLTKIGATGFVSEGAYGLGHGLLEGKQGTDLLKDVAMYGAIGGVADVTLTKVIGPAISKVLQRFKGKPVATETIERAVAKDIGVNWDNMNETQRNAIRKTVQNMQGEAVSSGKALNVGQEFTMRDVTPQDRLKQVLPEGPLALPQPKQNFTLEPEPFKKQIPKVDFEKPRPIQTPQPKTETFGNTTFEIGQKPGTPIEARDFENVGHRSVKAISFENPQIRPYYQYEAQNLLGEMQYAVPGKRTVAYNEFDEMVFTGQKKSVSDSIETIQAITGASYKEIEKGLQDIIHDKGRENNALSKRIELIIDENLSSGYKAFDGRQVPPNQDYLAAKKSLYLQPKLVQSQANPIDKTFHSQYNSEAEIRKQLAKYYSGFGQEGLDEATGAIADLQRTESQIRNRRKQELGGPGSLSGRKAGGIQDKPYKTVGLSFSRNLIDTGKVNLTGHKFNSVDELATVAQVFRDPRFETFRKIYTRGNQIVGTEAVSSRMPRVSVSFLGDADTHIKKQAEKMKRLGADGYYLLHNHPSGNPVPSKEDIVLTQHFANRLDGFKGHIIINSNKYTELYPVDTGGIVRIGGKENIPLNLGDDLLLSPSINNGLLGARVNSTEILAGMAKAIQMDENMSVLFFADAKLYIKGIQEVSNKMLNDVNFSGFLRNQAREHGGSSVFVVGDSSIQKQVENLIQHGFVTDAYMKDIGVNLRDNVPFIPRGDWMGLDARQQGRMIRPPKPIEDAPILRNERQLRLNAPQNFELKDPIYKKQIPREFDKTPIPTELPDWITPEPARFKKTIEVPARKLQPDLTPPPINATKQPDLMPPKIEKKIVEPVLKATQKVDEGTLFNVKEMKDISGFQGYATDVYRNFKQAFGKNYDKVKKTILDPFDASKKQNADFQKTWVERLNKEVVEGLGIKKGSKLSELVQKFGEGTLSEVEFNSIKPDDLKKIQQADAWFRKAYNELIDQVNAVRQSIYPNNPDKIIPKRKDYYRHFQEINNDIQGLKNIFATPAQIDPNLEGISEFTKPKAAWKSWAQKRTGAGEFKNDAVGGFLNYLPSASYGIHIDPHISVFAKLARDLSKASKDTKNINNFIRFLNRYSQDLAGKTNPVDRIAQEVTGRKFFRAVDWLNRRVKANVILGNVGSALSQLGNVPQGIAYAKQYSVPGIQRTIRSIFQPNEAIQKSGFISERYLDKIYRQFDTDLLSKPRNLAVWMMEKSDEIGTHIIWNSAYEKAIAEGAENAIKQADDITRDLVAGRGIGEVPIGQKSKIIQTLMPFTLEVANLWKVQKDMLAKKDIVGLLMLYGSAYGYNEIMEKTRGTRIVFDPIDALIDAFEEDLTPLERGGRVAGEVIGNIPMGQFLGSMYPEYGASIGGLELPTRKQLFGRNDPTRFGTGLLVQKGLQDPLYKVAMPFGGAQLQKTIKGLDAINNQGVYGNKEKTKLKYPVSDDITNTIKGALFGVGALNETRPYYDQDRRPLSENQTLEIDSLKGEARKDAYEYLMLQRKYNSLVDKWKKETDPAEKLKLFLQIERLQKGEG